MNESHWLHVLIKNSKLSIGAPGIIRVTSKMNTVAAPQQYNCIYGLAKTKKQGRQWVENVTTDELKRFHG